MIELIAVGLSGLVIGAWGTLFYTARREERKKLVAMVEKRAQRKAGRQKAVATRKAMAEKVTALQNTSPGEQFDLFPNDRPNGVMSHN